MRLLADGMASLEEHCVRGIEVRREHIAERLELGYLSEAQFDAWVQPARMLHPGLSRPDS